MEIGAGKKPGQKRQRSSSTAAEAEPSAKKVTSNETEYTMAWLKKKKLVNIIELTSWAKYKFRFVLVTIEPSTTALKPYLTCEERIILAEECYQLSQKTLNLKPEPSLLFSCVYTINTN